MNTNTDSKHPAEQYGGRSSKRIAIAAAARLGIALVAGLLLATPCAKAETKLSTEDKDFIHATALSGITELKLGELAVQKGMRDDVRAFGQMMVKDRTAINADLKALAAQKGETLPDRLDTNNQGLVDKMAALTGEEFDQAYIGAMITAHKEESAQFKTVSDKTKDADIQSFVDKCISVVDAHLKRIVAMKK